MNLNTNFLEELQNLDINEIGRWPFVFRAIFVALAFVVATSGGYYYFVFEQKMPVLERAESEEADLKRERRDLDARWQELIQ